MDLLLVEDDQSLADLLCEDLTEAGYAVRRAQSLAEGVAAFRERAPDLILTDGRLPDGHGRAFLELARTSTLAPAVLLMTAFGEIEEAVDSLRAGAADFLTKPIDSEHLLLRLQKVVEVRDLRRRLAALDVVGSPASSVEPPELDLRSPAWTRLCYQISQVAGTPDPILITGQSGVGKEVVARRIHRESHFANGPFVPVNCAGIPETLLESELFGHVAGAFTGAKGARAGLFEQAAGGSILLDEIGEMPPSMQAKLLRVLQDHVIRPLGAERERPVQVRVLAATHRNLEEQVAAGGFREDLFFRLEIFELEVPPLRERREDIPALAAHFLAEAAREFEKPVEALDAEALQALADYAFPGNIRELRSALRRAVAYAPGEIVRREDLPVRVRRSGPTMEVPPVPAEGGFGGPPFRSLEQLRQDYARHVLAACNGNKQKTARLLGIGRKTLYALLDCS
ncbi:MAG: sigma-54-dependent transcriptional regulator [Opitutales bacterium]